MDKHIAVASIMTTPVITVRPNDTMEKVQNIFKQHTIHHIPVVDGEGVVTGIISKTDYLKLLHGFTLFRTQKAETYNDAVLRSLLAREVMTKQVATLRPNDSAAMAASFFRENLFHAIPIVDQDKKLLGIVTTYDLLNYAFNGASGY
jgi:acetoin utilization protein AcuB